MAQLDEMWPNLDLAKLALNLVNFGPYMPNLTNIGSWNTFWTTSELGW